MEVKCKRCGVLFTKKANQKYCDSVCQYRANDPARLSARKRKRMIVRYAKFAPSLALLFLMGCEPLDSKQPRRVCVEYKYQYMIYNISIGGLCTKLSDYMYQCYVQVCTKWEDRNK